jgi:hypothetical protein
LLAGVAYLKRTGGQFSCLPAIMDAGAKEISARASSLPPELDFVLETVKMLIANHGAEL